LVLAFAHALDELAVPLVTGPELAGALTLLQGALQIVKHQQAAALARIAKEEGQLAVQAVGQIGQKQPGQGLAPVGAVRLHGQVSQQRPRPIGGEDGRPVIQCNLKRA